MELNTRNWNSYKISDLFFTYTGSDLIIGNIQEGEIPVISHTSDNNGIKIYSEIIDGQLLFDHEKTLV